MAITFARPELLWLLAVLPFYFSTGMVMTTDAPLVAAWAATLYYMERALIADQNSAWLGMGIAFGLGILSKTIGQVLEDMAELAETTLVKASSLYRTAPVQAGGPDLVAQVADEA